MNLIQVLFSFLLFSTMLKLVSVTEAVNEKALRHLEQELRELSRAEEQLTSSQGFSLLEALVSSLLICLLMVMSVPFFGGASERHKLRSLKLNRLEVLNSLREEINQPQYNLNKFQALRSLHLHQASIFRPWCPGRNSATIPAIASDAISLLAPDSLLFRQKTGEFCGPVGLPMDVPLLGVALGENFHRLSSFELGPSKANCARLETLKFVELSSGEKSTGPSPNQVESLIILSDLVSYFSDHQGAIRRFSHDTCENQPLVFGAGNLLTETVKEDWSGIVFRVYLASEDGNSREYISFVDNFAEEGAHFELLP